MQLQKCFESGLLMGYWKREFLQNIPAKLGYFVGMLQFLPCLTIRHFDKTYYIFESLLVNTLPEYLANFNSNKVNISGFIRLG